MAADPADDAPGDVSGYVGDGREKFVRVTLGTGERIEHGDVYLGYSASDFVVSEGPAFDDEDLTWYPKEEIARVEVVQHHSMCAITTAVAGDEAVLDPLRGFRDDAMARTPAGRALLRVYDVVGPPVAATLARRPDGLAARVIRRLVVACAGLARARECRRSPVARAALSGALVLVYVVGVLVGLSGHLAEAGRRSRATATESGSGSRER